MSRASLLWYREPSSTFVTALPIGNGRLGAMVHGAICNEKWRLNEDSVWYGSHMNRNPNHARANLAHLRQLINDGLLKQAEQLVLKAFLGTPESMRHYETAGCAIFSFYHQKSEASHYRRWLDLELAVTGVSYKIGDVIYEREVFASHPHGVICANFTCSKDGCLNFDLRLFRGEETNVYVDSVDVRDSTLHVTARTGGGGVVLCLSATVKLKQGNAKVIGETIVVEQAREARVLIAIETSFRHREPLAACHELIQTASEFTYEKLRGEHIDDYRSLESLCSLRLGASHSVTEFVRRPTDEWLNDAKTGSLNPCLSTWSNVSPSESTGHLVRQYEPALGQQVTININIQMNYWPSETCNLSQCHQPLLAHIKRLAENGAQTAEKMYGCRGWVAHHNTDIWADSAPQDRWLPATLWPMSGAWLCLHVWEHFLFTNDVDFLHEYIHIIKGSVEFFLDFLVDHNGQKVTSPSLSPENQYRLPNGEEGSICMAPTIDTVILRHLFNAFLSASQILKLESDVHFLDRVTSTRNRLPPFKIGQFEQIQEWLEDHEEVDPGHRHISHLWGLFPGSWSVKTDQKLMQACKTTLARRAAHGGGHTGWSRAWMIVMWARLGDGDAALAHIGRLLKDSTHANLFNDHPPFQIDGNFGAISGIAEMLLQSHEDHILLLPALPDSWPEGCVNGLCARGGFVFDVEWRSCRLSKARVVSTGRSKCQIRAHCPVRVLQSDVVLATSHHQGETLAFDALPMTTYELLPES